jgi:Fe(3+) dicitrate transport protein
MNSRVLLCLSAFLLLVPVTLPAAEPAPDTAVVEMPRVDVVGRRSKLDRIPGSAHVLDARTLARARVWTANEALRKLPGLAARDEEGFGLRPNVGIRGLNPTRSTKTTLLEDGVPLAYAPYGDNASYYHPPVERFATIELMKGAGQILFGPQTIGGLINYVTPAPPVHLGGFLSAAGGSRDYTLGRARLGGHGMLLDYLRKAGDGAREHMASELHDLNLKAVVSGRLTLRANLFTEASTLTYSGLTQAEFERQGPRYNPFHNDRFASHRYGASATHRLPLGAGGLVTTNLYVARFDRDWWRQSSTTTDAQGGPGVLAARLAGDRIDPDTIASIQGRLRGYTTWGVEPRLHWMTAAGPMRGELQAGVRGHFEAQDRVQVNGAGPRERSGARVEDNLRHTRAWSAFLAHRAEVGRWSVTPGVRYEHIGSSRVNRLPGGASGADALGRWIPSLGATWNPGARLTMFAGVHGGFAPPRTEDVIAANGTATDVRPEESVNWEMGARFAPAEDAEVHATLFRNDFRRLIAVGSIAGGSTPLAEGEAAFAGAELSAAWRPSGGASLRGAWTWIPEAEQTTAFHQVVGGAAIAGSAAGNRQPYAPEHMVSATAGWRWRPLDAEVELVHVGRQFTDFANTIAPSADGQRGVLAPYTIWNAALNARLAAATAFVAVKNLGDLVYLVDRTRGIQVGAPRLIQAGIEYGFGAAR